MFTKTLAALAIVSYAEAKTWPIAHGDEYIAKSASDKLDFLWEQITSDSSSGSWLNLPGVLIEGMKETFDSPGDDMPCYTLYCRTKDIHSVGVVSKVKFEVSESPFSGIFKGSDYGLIRHSTAAPYSSSGKNIKPGLGLKLLRDGVDSANLVSMFSVDGQDNWNFFANNWSNHIPKPESKALIPLAMKFHTATEYIQAVGLSDMAKYDQTGAETTPVFPFSLRFEPSGQFDWPETYEKDPLEQLMSIPSGSTLWDVYGWDAPKELGGTEHLIGSLVSTSETIKSWYSDEMLLIRHQRAEEDIALKPEWKEYYPAYSSNGGTTSHSDGSCEYSVSEEKEFTSSCPFAFLTQ